MRKALIGILLAATAATPVLAQSTEPGRRWQPRAEQRQQTQRSEPRAERQAQRSEARETRQAISPEQRQQGRTESGAQREARRPERPSTPAPTAAELRAAGRNPDRPQNRAALEQRIRETREASQASAVGLSPAYQRKAAENQAQYERRLQAQYRENRSDRRDDRRDGRQDGRNDRGDWQQDRRNDRRDWSNGRRDDRQDWRNDRRDDRRNWNNGRNDRRDWNRGWRQDRRYDWQRYRYSNRNLYRMPAYYAPYRGYAYSRFSIGLILNSGFYSSRYWIADPWYYRLPPAPAGTRWVRYYDDVLLVDTYTGEVIDAIYDFFW